MAVADDDEDWQSEAITVEPSLSATVKLMARPPVTMPGSDTFKVLVDNCERRGCSSTALIVSPILIHTPVLCSDAQRVARSTTTGRLAVEAANSHHG